MTADMFPEAHVDPTLDENRRYTTRATIEWCMARVGIDRFDLDVAADAECHWAHRWYAAPGTPPGSGALELNGLAHPWGKRGTRWNVWCNPPFDNLPAWVQKANYEAHTQDARILMLMPANRTEQPFWQNQVEPHRDREHVAGVPLRTHFLPGRTRFGHPGNPEGVNVGAPQFGCVLLVWG